MSLHEDVKADGDEEVSCAICMENSKHLCILPCCHKTHSSVQFCTSCVEELCSRSSISTFSCPTCRSFVGLEDGKLVIKRNVGTCSACHIVHANPANSQMCQECLKKLNLMSHLRYECEQCLGLQCIPRPMWRDQLTTSSFTRHATWICYQGCSGSRRTSWRLLDEDVQLVPHEDRPASWKFYEMLEALAEAKTKSKERKAGFWSCIYLTAYVAGAVMVLDTAASKLFQRSTT